jgi:hypothetical protein
MSPTITKRQQEYIDDIEKHLKVKFNLDPTRKNADMFIKQHKEEHDNYKKEHKIKNPMSKNQRKMIDEIEKQFGVKFKGYSYDAAFKFIEEYYIDIKSQETSKDRMEKFIVWKSNHLKEGKNK